MIFSFNEVFIFSFIPVIHLFQMSWLKLYFVNHHYIKMNLNYLVIKTIKILNSPRNYLFLKSYLQKVLFNQIITKYLLNSDEMLVILHIHAYLYLKLNFIYLHFLFHFFNRNYSFSYNKFLLFLNSSSLLFIFHFS